MFFRKGLGVLGGVALLSGLGAIASPPSYAGDVQFACDASGALPVTRAQNATTGASINVIVWYSEYFANAGYDSLTRCQQVSSRFQTFYDSGALNYVTAGIVNRLPVVCAAGPGSSCNRSNVLFTLKPGSDAAATLQRLFDVRDLGGSPLLETNGIPYIDMKKKLAPVASATTNTKPVTPRGNDNNPPTPRNPGRAF